MADTLEPLQRTKTIQLTTYKRDGTPVPTPVSIAFDGDRAFFLTWHTAWKVRRLRNNSRVEVAPSTLRGEPTGDSISARATLLSGAEARRAARALGERHRVLHAISVPLMHRLKRVRTLHYELTSVQG